MCMADRPMNVHMGRDTDLRYSIVASQICAQTSYKDMHIASFHAAFPNIFLTETLFCFNWRKPP
jgi:hypothetical protein